MIKGGPQPDLSAGSDPINRELFVDSVLGVPWRIYVHDSVGGDDQLITDILVSPGITRLVVDQRHEACVFRHGER